MSWRPRARSGNRLPPALDKAERSCGLAPPLLVVAESGPAGRPSEPGCPNASGPGALPPNNPSALGAPQWALDGPLPVCWLPPRGRFAGVGAVKSSVGRRSATALVGALRAGALRVLIALALDGLGARVSPWADVRICHGPRI